MTENEKLRALLAEAREALVRAENRMMSPPHQVPEAIARIDAALAEPVGLPLGVTWQSVKDLALSAARERDKARAEVERLRGIVDAAAVGVTEMLSKLPDRERAAYQRGAEAMREAAAGIFDAPISTPKREVLLAWAEAIRALPIPEDKR